MWEREWIGLGRGKGPAAPGGCRLGRRAAGGVYFGRIRAELAIMTGGNHSPLSLCFHAACHLPSPVDVPSELV